MSFEQVTVTIEVSHPYSLEVIDLIASKKASGMAVDLEDIRLLTLDDSE